MLPSYSLFHIIIAVLFNIIQSQITILQDGIAWIDNYAIDTTGTTGWSYPSDITPTTGSEEPYHVWYYEIEDRQYAGYFYRKFQCEYKPTIDVTFNAYFGCAYVETTDGGILYINENKFEFIMNDNTNTFFNITAQPVIDKANQCD
eukprot:874061_1